MYIYIYHIYGWGTAPPHTHYTPAPLLPAAPHTLSSYSPPSPPPSVTPPPPPPPRPPAACWGPQKKKAPGGVTR